MAAKGRWQQVSGTAAVVYEHQLVPAMFAPWAPMLIELAGVGPGERILDVACGTGVVTRLAAARTDRGGRVVGLDINQAMLAVARTLPPVAGAEITWVEASALELPFPGADFDVVLCQHGLQQVQDRPAALQEMRRVLAPGGRLAVCVWGRLEANPGMAALVAALGRHVGSEAAANRLTPFALSDPEQVIALLTAAGFRGVHLRTREATARFASSELMVAAQFAATPLSTLGAISAETRQAVAADVRASLGAYIDEHGLAVPMAAHLCVAAV